MLVIFSLAGFLEVASYGQLSAFTPLYLPRIGVAAADVAFWVGVITSLANLFGLPFLPFWGALADRYGRKPLIIRSFIAAFFALGVTAVAPNIAVFTIARGFQALALGNTGLILATLADHAPAARVAFAFGVVNGANPFGAFVGPLRPLARAHPGRPSARPRVASAFLHARSRGIRNPLGCRERPIEWSVQRVLQRDRRLGQRDRARARDELRVCAGEHELRGRAAHRKRSRSDRCISRVPGRGGLDGGGSRGDGLRAHTAAALVLRPWRLVRAPGLETVNGRGPGELLERRQLVLSEERRFRRFVRGDAQFPRDDARPVDHHEDREAWPHPHREQPVQSDVEPGLFGGLPARRILRRLIALDEAAGKRPATVARSVVEPRGKDTGGAPDDPVRSDLHVHEVREPAHRARQPIPAIDWLRH